MAKIKPLLGELAGSIGGNTFSRNKGGQYVRQRSIPTQPDSARQSKVRGILSQLSRGWSNTLTQAQRDQWVTWAQTHPVLDTFGNAVLLTGHQAYIGLNARLVDAGATATTTPPSSLGPSSFTTMSATFASASVTATITFAPAIAATERVMVRCTGPVSPGSRPNIRQTKLAGYSAVAATSPLAIALPSAPQTSREIAVYVAKMDAAGQLSPFARAQAAAV